MGQNKAQNQAAERSKKTSEKPVGAAETMTIEETTAKATQAITEQKKAAATPAPAAAATQPSKQQATLDKLKEAWTARGVDLSKLEAKPDGKFLLVTVAAGWPIVQLGPTGGIVLPQIRSYAKAFDAAVDGLAVFEKQNARDSKKQQASAPAPKAPEAVT